MIVDASSKKKHKKKKDEAGDSDGSAYRLSNFFTQGSDDDKNVNSERSLQPTFCSITSTAFFVDL
jgi:hypothetical protein